jgi:hypothetical protein
MVGQRKIFAKCLTASDIHIIKFDVLIRARHDTEDSQKSKQGASK